MKAKDILLVGMKQKVAAFSRADGTELWSTDLGGMTGAGFVTLICDGVQVFAYTAGHLHCLELLTGRILWRNELAGYGYGLAMLALPEGGSSPSIAAAQAMMDSQQSAAGVVGAAGAS